MTWWMWVLVVLGLLAGGLVYFVWNLLEHIS